jgi:hypothetical protein
MCPYRVDLSVDYQKRGKESEHTTSRQQSNANSQARSKSNSFVITLSILLSSQMAILSEMDAQEFV